jgi:hypothetical protein
MARAMPHHWYPTFEISSQVMLHVTQTTYFGGTRNKESCPIDVYHRRVLLPIPIQRSRGGLTTLGVVLHKNNEGARQSLERYRKKLDSRDNAAKGRRQDEQGEETSGRNSVYQYY